ncbi:DUF4391 domain-containing protein [Olleya sp. UBA1516]|uniref:DUF4391 domain-containing protein n=1 Tax=Olleya sp. UBA1516 TaxID=1947013 RepID=UPI0025EFF78D|nr:DUF4391 domain-containing protein [Olleya sp. UBA1516]|tara:strand:+ start:8531 stop:9283 length:753 start_codon:yes stop_codon:yes gene_type:complete
MENLIKLLNIDKRCVVDKRITKVAISNNNSLNTSEKKILKEVITEMRWLASYKPFNSAIPEYISETESYDEIQIISVAFIDTKFTKQVINLLQKNMPYHLVLLLESKDNFAVSVAKKSINQTDSLKRTIDEVLTSTWIDNLSNNEINESFLKHLNTKSYNTLHLKTFYEGFIKSIYLYETSLITGSFNVKENKEVIKDANALREIEILDKEIISIKSQIKKGTVFSDKVRLNMKLKEVEKNKQLLTQKLY